MRERALQACCPEVPCTAAGLLLEAPAPPPGNLEGVLQAKHSRLPETPRALSASAGECDNIAGELWQAQADCKEAERERDELAASLAALKAEHADLGDAHTALQ